MTKKRVYLSPSGQVHNIGVGKYGTEEARCRKIATLTATLLAEAGVEVKITPRDWNTKLSDNAWLSQVVAASNSYAADVHVAIHTNAGPSSAKGTDAWYYPGSAKGKRLTEAIYKRVQEVSPGGGRGIHTSPVFYETRAAKAPVCYIELGFHSNKADAEHLAAHPELYAEALAAGILEYAGIGPTPALLAAADYPKLKNELVHFLIRANNIKEPIGTAGCDGFDVLAETWGEPARTLAWRISGRLDGVQQTAQPTTELLKALLSDNR